MGKVVDGGPIFNAKAPAPPFENMGTILSIEKYLNEIAVVNRLGRQRHHQKTNVNVTAGAIFNHNRQHHQKLFRAHTRVRP